MTKPMRFWRGRQLYQIMPDGAGTGFVGLCDGRMVGSGRNRHSVMRIILLSHPGRG